MQKILTLGQKQWLSGVSASYQYPTGIWAKARGVNPFVDPNPLSTNLGVLQMGGDAYDISSGASDGYPLDGVIRNDGSGAGNLYMITSTGKFWKKDLSDDSIVTNLRASSTIATPSNGMAIYQASDATVKFLYYFTSQNKIGRWDFDGPTGTWVDDWDTGIPTAVNHPTHFFKGAVYFGMGNGIGKIYSVSTLGASTATTAATGALIFPADFQDVCMEDDGNYLIAGITKNSASSQTIMADTRIIFWDTVSQNFNKEWVLPDYGINSIVRYKDGFVAFGGLKLWYFNFSTQPTHLLTLTSTENVIYNSSQVFNRAADRFNNAVIWGGYNERYLNSFGSFVEGTPTAYHQPFKRSGVSIGSPAVSFVKATGKFNRLYVGGNTASAFVYYKYDDAGALTVAGSDSSATYPDAETIYLDLKGEWHIQKVSLVLSQPLASGDLFTLKYQTDETNSSATFGSLAYDSTEPNPRRKYYELFLDGGVLSTQLKLLFNFGGGNVKIKELTLYGEPIIY